MGYVSIDTSAKPVAERIEILKFAYQWYQYFVKAFDDDMMYRVNRLIDTADERKIPFDIVDPLRDFASRHKKVSDLLTDIEADLLTLSTQVGARSGLRLIFGETDVPVTAATNDGDFVRHLAEDHFFYGDAKLLSVLKANHKLLRENAVPPGRRSVAIGPLFSRLTYDPVAQQFYASFGTVADPYPVRVVRFEVKHTPGSATTTPVGSVHNYDEIGGYLGGLVDLVPFGTDLALLAAILAPGARRRSNTTASTY
jgi:hypothetical protein